MDANLKQSLSKLLNTYKTIHSSSDDHDGRYVKISDIINTTATNQPGYALDARQANPSISGTMAEKIETLQNSQESTDTVVTNIEDRVIHLEAYEQWGTF